MQAKLWSDSKICVVLERQRKGNKNSEHYYALEVGDKHSKNDVSK